MGTSYRCQANKGVLAESSRGAKARDQDLRPRQWSEMTLYLKLKKSMFTNRIERGSMSRRRALKVQGIIYLRLRSAIGETKSRGNREKLYSP